MNDDEEEQSQYRGENDAYNGIERPDFFASAKERFGPKTGLSGASTLRNSEKGASAGGSTLAKGSSPVNQLKNSEASPAGFVNKVTGRPSIKKGKSLKDGKFKGKIKGKKLSPIIFIALIIGCGGGAVLLGQSAMPLGIVNRIIGEWDTSYVSNHGRVRTLFIESAQKGKISEDMQKHLKEQGIEYDAKKKTFTFEDKDGKKVTKKVKEALKNDDFFKEKFNTATQREAGHFSTTFGKLAVKVKTRLKISFSNWADWKNDDASKDEEAKKEAYKKKVKDGASGDTSLSTGSSKGKDDENPDSKEDSTKNSNSKENIKEKLNGTVSALNIGSGIVCAKAMVSTALAVEAMGIRMTSMLSTASLLFEAVQKAEAGDGDEAPIHEAMATLTAPDDKGETAMEASGIQELFGSNFQENRTDGNVENVVSKAGEVINGFTECAVASTVSSLASIAVSLIPGAGAAKGAVKIFAGLAGGTALAIGVEKWVENYIDNAAEAIKAEYNATDNASGIAYGNQVSSGGAKMLSSFSQANGASYGTAEKVAEYQNLKDTVIAEQAKYDRKTLSPFDISSEHTFFGSLVYNAIIPFAISSSGSRLTGSLSQISSITSSSLNKLLPKASAWGQTKVIQSNGDCPIANSVGAKATSQCIPYVITDTSTMNDDCDAECVINHISDDNLIKNKDNPLMPTIKDDSDLYKYQAYCGTRDTQPGIYDGNITEKIHNASSGDSVINWFSSNEVASQTVLGDIATVVQNAKDSSEKGWINGEYCVAGNSKWGEFKWFQRFLEDQNLLANMGTIEQSAGAAALATYYEKNPIDNSREGTIARFTGLTKDQVVALEQELDYQNWLADYDPSELGPVNYTEIEERINLSTNENLNDQASGLAISERVTYMPLRNRAMIV